MSSFFFESMVVNLDTISGIDRKGAIMIVAEMGGDMSHFLMVGYLCSWGGMCPGQNESAGKCQSGCTCIGNRYLRGLLIEGGFAVSRVNNMVLQACYQWVKCHRGHKKVVVAVGYQILEIAYYFMRDGTIYDELGADYFDRWHRDCAIRCHVR